MCVGSDSECLCLYHRMRSDAKINGQRWRHKLEIYSTALSESTDFSACRTKTALVRHKWFDSLDKVATRCKSTFRLVVNIFSNFIERYCLFCESQTDQFSMPYFLIVQFNVRLPVLQVFWGRYKCKPCFMFMENKIQLFAWNRIGYRVLFGMNKKKIKFIAKR